MTLISSKGQLGIALSKLKGFTDPKVRSEQYLTDSEIGAEVLWNVSMLEKDLKVSADFGCGTGLLGIGLLLIGARKVHFIDSDPKVMETLQQNLDLVKSEHPNLGESELHISDISDFNQPIDLIIQNPPFGVKVRHADRPFIEQAMKWGKVIYSFHKTESLGFLEKISQENGFEITHQWDFKWPLKATYSFHSKKIKHIDVSCFRFEKTQK